MSPINEPFPKSTIGTPKKVSSNIISARELKIPTGTASPQFLDVLESRESIRETGPITEEQLGELLWFAARTKSNHIGRAGLASSHRASPSSGGLHPIDILVIDFTALSLALYNPIDHRLELLQINPEALEHYRALIQKILPSHKGIVFQFIGNLSLIEAAYENPQSLLWRDAGCLMNTICLCANAMNLAACPLGLLGTELTTAIDPQPHILPCGALIVGKRV